MSYSFWSRRWYSTAFRLGILISTFLIDNGTCKEKKSRDPNLSLAAINTSVPHHSHNNWGVWTSSDKTILPWDESNAPNIVPLTLDEHKSRKSTKDHSRGKEKKSYQNKQKSGNNDGGGDEKQTKSSKEKGKSGSRSVDTAEELSFLREKALSLGSIVVEFLNKEVLSSSKGERSGRSFLSDITQSFTHTYMAQDRQEGGVGEDRGVIDWLARLIGVQGKTLGEFLREYQVHVLYDLVFTFFKWIFFLYAGLLIP